ncbi:hypothetical protein CLM82_25445, partial [Streptomyces albidoflavus]
MRIRPRRREDTAEIPPEPASHHHRHAAPPHPRGQAPGQDAGSCRTAARGTLLDDSLACDRRAVAARRISPAALGPAPLTAVDLLRQAAEDLGPADGLTGT